MPALKDQRARRRPPFWLLRCTSLAMSACGVFGIIQSWQWPVGMCWEAPGHSLSREFSIESSDWGYCLRVFYGSAWMLEDEDTLDGVEHAFTGYRGVWFNGGRLKHPRVSL